MQELLLYIRDYVRNEDKRVIILCSLQTAILIFFNYRFHLETRLITDPHIPFPRFTGHFIIFITAFSLPYLFYSILKKRNYFSHKAFTIFIILGAAIFSIKMSLITNLNFSSD